MFTENPALFTDASLFSVKCLSIHVPSHRAYLVSQEKTIPYPTVLVWVVRGIEGCPEHPSPPKNESLLSGQQIGLEQQLPMSSY